LATDLLLFYVFAALAVGASLMVVLGRNPMHSVLLLIVSFAALAGLYIGLDAPFAAAVQIIIYAGAIMVLFLFVVMLLNAHREGDADGRGARLAHGPLRFGGVLAVLLVAELGWALSRAARGGGDLLSAGRGAQPGALDPDHRRHDRRGGPRKAGVVARWCLWDTTSCCRPSCSPRGRWASSCAGT
jgi:NADH-quinone oxidoreductase subunit J